ncbi:coiled-coil domain-containing protein 186 [Plakobranchus ocellatus]|uniref:Coiled-coil domain-containing protein 186 n=1 Tax=Plakobranchus ocellatus TaxID=259542 RepID=A0AAV4CYF9_9GAST|nr:coiled-coil domain-containing protein 186 [Plakobranchus ocellatus]
MSWVEPENGGGEDVTENPDPEEDSDLPIRPRDRDNDGEGVRSEQDRPEDDLAIAPEEVTAAEVAIENQVFNSESSNNEQRISPGNEEETGACVEREPVGQIENAEDEVGVCSSNLESEEVVVCNNKQKNVSDNFEREGGIAEYDAAPESCLAGRVDILMEARPLPEDMAAVGERSEEENSNRKADNEEGPEGEDSFEQDEETAAPECENEVRQDSTSESDRQPIHSHIHVTENLPSLALTNGVPPILPSCPSPVSRNSEEDLSHLRSENAISPDVSGTSVGSSGMNFSGNVEVSGTAEDAPEAELDNFHSTSLPLRESAPSVLNVEYGHAACEFLPQALDSRCSEPPTSGISINHSNLEHLPDAGNDHDMQAPECDRENSPQPPPNIDESNSIGESVQLEAVSFEQTVNDNQAASLSGQEAISLPSASACQQLNTCDSSIKGAQNEHSSTNNANLRSDCAHMSQERKITLSQGANEEKCEANEQSDAMLRNPYVQESFECSSGQSSTIQAGLSLSAHCNNSKDSSPQDKIMTSASSDLYPPKVTSPVVSGQNEKHPPSSIPTTLPGEKISPTPRENPSRHSEFSIPNMPDNTIPNAARQKEDPQKRPSNSSSSSSSSTSQRTSPAKAVAAALFHVMGMDSKFTGRDLALALQSDDEEDLMSELDAELLSSSASSISKPKSQKQETKVQLQRQSKSKTKSVTKSDSGQLLNGLPSTADVQQLQEHNRQLLEQLRIRDEEIARLSREPKLISQSEQAAAEIKTSSHSPDDLYLPQIKELEKTIAQQGAEIKSLTEKLYTHDAAAKRTVLSLQNEMKSRVDQATKMYDECRKEKDVIVMKFAEAEAKNMEAKRFVEKSEAKIRDALRERENMASGLKAARADRQKVVANYDVKCAEVSNLHKELEKMKEALNSGEYRIKWFQNKLKDELEAHKETKGNLEKTNLRLKEAREETELIRKECQAIVKRYQESEEIKSNTLEKDLKLKESELQTHLQERNDSQELHQMLKQELESLKSQHKDTIEEAKTLRDKVITLA